MNAVLLQDALRVSRDDSFSDRAMCVGRFFVGTLVRFESEVNRRAPD